MCRHESVDTTKEVGAMNRVPASVTSVCLAFFVAACGSSGQPSPQGGSGGGSVVDTGGSGGNASGGSTGNASGGSTGNASGGSSGNASGGSSGGTGGKTGATGGSSGNPSGGSSGATGGKTGATGGTTTSGSGGSQSGGAQGTGTGGSSGGTGGKTGATGGTTTSGSGGSQAGGAQGTGGTTSAGTGGATTASTAMVTSASNAYWTSGAFTEVTSGTADVTVNDTTAQTWEGFGGSFNEKGWSYLTTQAMKDEAIKLLFSKDGCNFAWGRIPIGASDYGMDRYTDDEVSSGSDTSMASFSITRDKDKLIPYIKAAQAIKSDIRFWASPWTPPTWMKATPYLSGNPTNAFDGGTMKSDDATLKAYAQYLVKWVQAFQEQEIKVEIVSPQNEPNYQQNYPSCHWETSTFVTFVGKYFGPAIDSAKLNIKIMDGTLSNPSGDADIGQKVLQDSTAKGYIGAIGVQWGMSDTNQVNTLKNLAGGIPIWLSETKCGGTMGSTSPAPNDFNYAKDTWGYITGAIKNGLTAYNAWNMVLDKGGMGIDNTRKWPQNALLVADSSSITKTPAYYVYRHFSQFVDPGAKVVGTSGGDAIGFKNPDGTIVAVMYNSGSAKSTYTVSMGGKKLQFSMPGSGWATVKNK
jgi:glucosylceramidase